MISISPVNVGYGSSLLTDEIYNRLTIMLFDETDRHHFHQFIATVKVTLSGVDIKYLNATITLSFGTRHMQQSNTVLYGPS